VRLFLFCLWFLIIPATLAEEKTVVVVWPFEDVSFIPGNDAGQDDLGGLATEVLIARLLQSRRVEVVERQALDKVLEELNLSCSGLADKDACLRVGKIIGARKMLFGTYFLLDGRLHLLVRVVDVETSLIDGSVKWVTTPGELPQAMEEIAQQVTSIFSDQ